MLPKVDTHSEIVKGKWLVVRHLRCATQFSIRMTGTENALLYFKITCQLNPDSQTEFKSLCWDLHQAIERLWGGGMRVYNCPIVLRSHLCWGRGIKEQGISSSSFSIQSPSTFPNCRMQFHLKTESFSLKQMKKKVFFCRWKRANSDISKMTLLSPSPNP